MKSDHKHSTNSNRESPPLPRERGTGGEGFLTENFLLQNEFARILYHDYAKSLPIIDYHSHLAPADISNNRQFENLTRIWLEGDHYKWRAMRTLGIDERYITGNASDAEKFEQWAHTVPYTMRNPLYHWTHLELQRYFDVNVLLNPESSRAIYERCNQQLQQEEFRVQVLIQKMHVEVICTTDDPIDTLEHHQKIWSQALPFQVLPTFRPDKAFAIDQLKTYRTYLENLSSSAGIDITNFTSLVEALQKRIDFFHANGCRLADHGLEQLFTADTSFNPEITFTKSLNSEIVSSAEAANFKHTLLIELSKAYHAKGWVQQFHLGALRNNNSRLLQQLGPDTGFDSIGDFSQARALAQFLNQLDSTNQLAKTIIYNLNPADNEMMAAMIGNFNDGSIKGKIQYGSAWWFLDQKDGMTKQLNAISNMSLLSCFIGMLTDSRSFMSFPRHEYFRRILCNLIGHDVENGELPWDEKWLGKLVTDVCYTNAKSYFGFGN